MPGHSLINSCRIKESVTNHNFIVLQSGQDYFAYKLCSTGCEEQQFSFILNAQVRLKGPEEFTNSLSETGSAGFTQHGDASPAADFVKVAT